MAVYVCPVCKGKGLVSADFYNINGGPIINTKPVVCRTCNGTGVLDHYNITTKKNDDSKPSNYNPEGDPANKEVNWAKSNNDLRLNDRFLGKVGV